MKTSIKVWWLRGALLFLLFDNTVHIRRACCGVTFQHEIPACVGATLISNQWPAALPLSSVVLNKGHPFASSHSHMHQKIRGNGVPSLSSPWTTCYSGLWTTLSIMGVFESSSVHCKDILTYTHTPSPHVSRNQHISSPLSSLACAKMVKLLPMRCGPIMPLHSLSAWHKARLSSVPLSVLLAFLRANQLKKWDVGTMLSVLQVP